MAVHSPPQPRFADALRRALSSKARRLLYLTFALALSLGAGLYWLSVPKVPTPVSDAWQRERPALRAQLVWLETAARESDNPAQVLRYSLITGADFERLLATSEGATLSEDALPLLQTLQSKLARGDDISGVVAGLDALLRP